MEMSKPSHSFLMVDIVALRLRPLMILFTLDMVTPLREHRLLMEIFRCRHDAKRWFVATSQFYPACTPFTGNNTRFDLKRLALLS